MCHDTKTRSLTEDFFVLFLRLILKTKHVSAILLPIWPSLTTDVAFTVTQQHDAVAQEWRTPSHLGTVPGTLSVLVPYPF